MKLSKYWLISSLFLFISCKEENKQKQNFIQKKDVIISDSIKKVLIETILADTIVEVPNEINSISKKKKEVPNEINSIPKEKKEALINTIQYNNDQTDDEIVFSWSKEYYSWIKSAKYKKDSTSFYNDKFLQTPEIDTVSVFKLWRSFKRNKYGNWNSSGVTD